MTTTHIGTSPAGTTWNCHRKDHETDAAYSLRCEAMRVSLQRHWGKYNSKRVRVSGLTDTQTDLIFDVWPETTERLGGGVTWVEGMREDLLDIGAELLERAGDFDRLCDDVAGRVNKDLTDAQIEFGAKQAQKSLRAAGRKLLEGAK